MAKGTGGYIGRVLRVDLSRDKVSVEPLDASILRKFIGGAGLGAKVPLQRSASRGGMVGSGKSIDVFLRTVRRNALCRVGNDCGRQQRAHDEHGRIVTGERIFRHLSQVLGFDGVVIHGQAKSGPICAFTTAEPNCATRGT